MVTQAGSGACPAADQQHDACQDDPACYIVHRRAGDGHRAQPGAQHLALGQDARQHRKGGDAHRRAQEQGELCKAHAVVGEARVEQQRQHGPQEEGHGDAGVAGEQGDLPLVPEQLAFQLQTDQEHEQHQTDLAQGAQVSQAFRREQRCRDARRRQSEQRWSEQDARDHLADHLGLVHLLEQPAHQARHAQDDADLQQEQQDIGHQCSWLVAPEGSSSALKSSRWIASRCHQASQSSGQGRSAGRPPL